MLNPVIGRELRARMRGWRAIATLTVYLAVVSSFGLLFLYMASQEQWMGNNAAMVGRSLLSNTVMIEIFLVCFITPAFTAGVIAGERERQTHDLLLTTLLASRSVVTGKLISALAFVVLLIVAALPVQSIVFLLGGVAPDELAITFAILLATALGIGALGLLFSTMVRTTLAATVLSYIAVLVIVAGTSMTYYTAGSLTRTQPPEWIVYPNPFTAVGSVFSYTGGPPIPMPLPLPAPPVIVRAEQVMMKPVPGFAPGAAGRPDIAQPPPIWVFYIALYLATALVSVGLATFLIKPTHPWLHRLRYRR